MKVVFGKALSLTPPKERATSIDYSNVNHASFDLTQDSDRHMKS